MKALLANRTFYPFFVVQLTGAMNDNILKSAIVMAIGFSMVTSRRAHVDEWSNFAGVLLVLPYVIFSSLAGQVADKFEKSLSIRVIKTIEIGIVLIAACGFIFDNLLIMLLVIFLMAMHSTFFGPLKFSIVPELVEPKLLFTANGYIETGTFISILCGTILGGVIYSHFGSYIIGLILLLISIIGFVHSLFIPRAPSVNSMEVLNFNIFKSSLSMCKEILENRNLCVGVIALSWFWLFGFLMINNSVNYNQMYLNGDSDVLTLLFCAMTIGIAAGSLTCVKFTKGKLDLRLIPFGSLGMTLFALDFALAAKTPEKDLVLFTEYFHSFYHVRVFIDVLIMGFSAGIFSVPIYTYMQKLSSVEHRSRVFAVVNIFNALFMVSGSIITMVMLIFFPVKTVFLTLGVASAGITVYAFHFIKKQKAPVFE